ncbi:MAG TPA: cytochrome c oxidase subunit I [Dehalococcoidia bacterium]|nr:cytochrome c oxidase subunit I [Dehalococcoidia bacterium]
MATIARPMPGLAPRPSIGSRIWGVMTTVDHKVIGLLYLTTSMFFFLVGGVEALAIRSQLAKPNQHLYSAETYNALFTMHGTTMIFLVVMPMGVAFFNFIVPLQIGARDVAFPRLNALSYWLYLFGAIVINTGWFVGAAPDDGWFGYANLTTLAYSTGHNQDFWFAGLQILGVASLIGALNFAVTILNLRAPGMRLMRMPVFVWMTLVTSALLILALPVITVALIELLFDRQFATNFFNVTKGGDPVLWQHLFWLFGHPEVYIMILPAMGIVSEILPTFSRKPLFGYPVVVFSGVAIGFMSWGVWAHHMFTTGLGATANSAFAVSTMLIAVPTGVKIFNWVFTIWGGDVRLKTPFYFAIGFVAMFIIGGLSGVTHALVPSDAEQHQTYYIVAHFHYVLFGGAIFGLFGGIYYWFPKMTGRLLSEKIGLTHFWLMMIGFNMTFGPFHMLGLDGMPRRIYTYPTDRGWGFWNMVATIGAFTIALSILVFLINVFRSLRKEPDAGPDPWDARTLEWSIPSPPPEYNFATIPVVQARDPLWHQKLLRRYRAPRAESIAEQQVEEEPGHIHMPSPSYYPLITALGLPIMMYALIWQNDNKGLWGLFVAGALVLLLGAYGWATEPT